MGLSVNTNVGSMVALRSLNKTQARLELTQLKITTGFRINGPKDDASTFATAQCMLGVIAGMKAVLSSLA